MNKKFKILMCSLIVCVSIFTINHTIKAEQVDIKDVEIYTDIEELKGLTIVQFTDTHYNGSKDDKLMSKVVEGINSLDADLVLFTGDLIDFKYEGTDFEYLSNTLNSINSKYGKYAVYGNHDRNKGREIRYNKVLEDSGFKILVNEEELIKVGDSQVSLIGLDDVLLGEYKEVPVDSNSDYSICMVHEPDIADELGELKYKVQLSGHTHGGQVRLPFVGRLTKVKGGMNYDKGMYTLEDGRILYISSGIGNSRADIRIGNPSEIIVIKLV